MAKDWSYNSEDFAMAQYLLAKRQGLNPAIVLEARDNGHGVVHCTMKCIVDESSPLER